MIPPTARLSDRIDPVMYFRGVRLIVSAGKKIKEVL
jgi:hypothetical protein